MAVQRILVNGLILLRIILPTNGMKNRGLLVDPLEICFKCFPFLFQLLGNSASHHEFCAISILTIFNVYKMQICTLFNDPCIYMRVCNESDLKAVMSHHLTLDFTPPTHVSGGVQMSIRVEPKFT